MRGHTLSFILITVLILACLPPAGIAQIYKWTDKEGTVHLSDQPADLPEESTDTEDSAVSPAKKMPMKKGWTQDTLAEAIRGCTLGMIDSNLEGYRKRALEDGLEVTDEEMEKVRNLLYPLCHRTCKCVFDKMSREWSFEKLNNNLNTPEYQKYVTALFKNKTCPLPVPQE
jgi:hypothetical protein